VQLVNAVIDLTFGYAPAMATSCDHQQHRRLGLGTFAGSPGSLVTISAVPLRELHRRRWQT
jgi:hypothetical protein